MQARCVLFATVAIVLGVGLTACGGSKHGANSTANSAPSSPQSVVVPQPPRNANLVSMFALLRSRGFRVAVRTLNRPLGTQAWKTLTLGTVEPGPGARLRFGSTVTISTPRQEPCCLASLVVKPSHAASRVPSFVGRPLSSAFDWIARRRLVLEIARLPNLPPSNARSLFAAYRVVSQQPKPGAIVRQLHKAGGHRSLTYLKLVVSPR